MNEAGKDAHKSPDTLEREIDQTRADIGETVDALAQKFSPGEFLDRSLDMVKQHGGELAVNLRDSIKQNPLAVLLTGAGLAWLMSSTSHDRSGRWTSKAGNSLSDAREKFSGTGEQITGAMAGTRERLTVARDSVTETVSSTAASTRAQAVKAREGFNNLLEEQPLIIGALGIAVGAALGAAFPRTDVEDRFAGTASDAAKTELKEKGQEVYGQAREKAQKAAEAAEQAISEKQPSPPA